MLLNHQGHKTATSKKLAVAIAEAKAGAAAIVIACEKEAEEMAKQLGGNQVGFLDTDEGRKAYMKAASIVHKSKGLKPVGMVVEEMYVLMKEPKEKGTIRKRSSESDISSFRRWKMKRKSKKQLKKDEGDHEVSKVGSKRAKKLNKMSKSQDQRSSSNGEASAPSDDEAEATKSKSSKSTFKLGNHTIKLFDIPDVMELMKK